MSVLEAQLAFHKGHVCTCGQLEVQLESTAWKTLERSTTTAASSTAALAISDKLICFNKHMDLFIQHQVQTVTSSDLFPKCRAQVEATKECC